MNKYLFSAYAAMTSISGALKGAFNTEVKPELKSIVNDIVMPIISAVLLIVLIVRGVLVWKEYNHGQGELKWGQLLVIFLCLVIAISASSWMWSLIGW